MKTKITSLLFFILANFFFTEADSQIESSSVYSSLILYDGSYAVGTVSHGVFILTKNGKIEVSASVKNIGKVVGKEVVQLYIRELIGSLTRPVLELKGFEMIELQPSETKKVIFTINEKTIEFFTANSKWEAEAGDFKVFIGGNSAETLKGDFQFLK